MSESKVFHYVFIWHSYVDARSCPKCVALNGREYHDQDLFGRVLVDPEFGPIWNLEGDFSLMHGGVGTCRCQIEVRVIVETEQIEETRELENLYQSFGV